MERDTNGESVKVEVERGILGSVVTWNLVNPSSDVIGRIRKESIEHIKVLPRKIGDYRGVIQESTARGWETVEGFAVEQI